MLYHLLEAHFISQLCLGCNIVMVVSGNFRVLVPAPGDGDRPTSYVQQIVMKRRENGNMGGRDKTGLQQLISLLA